MKEKGLLEEFLKNHKYDPAQKYRYTDFSVAYEPMAYMDVSPPPPRGTLSLLPKATRQGLDSGLRPSSLHPPTQPLLPSLRPASLDLIPQAEHERGPA